MTGAGGARARVISLAILTVAATLLLPGVDAAERIVSTAPAEVPTTGGLRPGPLGLAPAPPTAATARPTAIRIERAEVDAAVEVIEIVDGVMQNPTGPWVVSWYKETAELGELGNAVMAGHLDYWDVGPAVFYNLSRVQPGDRIEVTGSDDQVYVYEVEWGRLYETATAPIQEIVGPTDTESLTLITCGGPFDPLTGQYLSRFVVRAVRVA